MNKDFEKALRGELCSDPTGDPKTVEFRNHFQVPVTLVYLDKKGFQDVSTMRSLLPGRGATFKARRPGDYFLITAADSGAFMCVQKVTPEDKHYAFGPKDLVQPSDVGPIPEPNTAAIIPNDSPRVVVGCSEYRKKAGNKARYRMTREQYWHRYANSYSLAWGEKRQVSLTTQSGRQQTSSKEETFVSSFDLGASIGWGPISASFSSSLSSTTTGFQQVTITEQSTSYVSCTLENTNTDDKDKGALLVFYWQLIDVISLFDENGRPAGSVSQAANPVLVKTYFMNQLKPPPLLDAKGERVPDPPLYPERLERLAVLDDLDRDPM